ncbi:MAG: M48 family metalloprotease [Bryobacteraceae bacterium]|nr:M48 family metalloprotease [Bryobacteraceae bacterium]
MVSRTWLFGLLLAVPLIGFGIAEAIQAHFNSQLHSVLRKEYPAATEQQLAQVTVARLCEDPSPELRGLCGTNANLNLMSRGALGAGAVGVALLLFISLAGRFARNSRRLLVILFTPGLYLAAVILIGLVLVHAAVAMAAIYYAESALIGRIHVGVIATIGLGAAVGVWAIARGTFSLVRKAHTLVIGKALTRQEAPRLWKEVEGSAHQLDALHPDNLVVGLDPNFFVTEADVTCLSGKLNGRTLYCSLPLCRILSKQELTSIIGHELGHFKGEDTKFSERFYPIYRGTASSLAALQAVAGEGSGSIPLLPAIAVFSYFLECFSVAESRLSRDRELAADRAGSSITSSRTLAAALVKLHAFTGVWQGLQEASANSLRQGKAFVNASRTYAEVVGQSAGSEALEGIAEVHLSHPTDSHPPLSLRLQSLQVGLNDVATDALMVTPLQGAITLISDAEKLEEEISEAYQVLLARQLGIDLEEASRAAEGGA